MIQNKSLDNDSYNYHLINPFLNSVFARNNSISGKLKELRANLSNSNNYTFIVPNTKVLEWSVDKETLLPYRDLFLQDDYLLSHIIQVSQTSQLSRNNQRARYYSTCNNKTIIIKDGYIHSHKGFNKYVRSKIIREYILYPSCDFLNNTAQFLVYEVEVPLIGIAIRSVEVSATLSSKYELATPGVGVGKDSKEKGIKIKNVFNGSSMMNKPNDGLIGDSHDIDLERLLSSNAILNKQILIPFLALIEEFDCCIATSEDELLCMFDSIFEESLQVFKRHDSTFQQLIKDDYSYEDITNSIYTFIETNLSDQLWNKLIEIRQQADSNLTSLINTIKYIDISQIGLPEEFTIKQLFYLDKKVWKATKELGRLGELYCAEEKIEVILSVIHILSSKEDDEEVFIANTKEAEEEEEDESTKSTSDKPSIDSTDNHLSVDSNEHPSGIVTPTLTTLSKFPNSPLSPIFPTPLISPSINADILVSLLLLVVLRSNLANLDSHLFYVRNFTYKDSDSGQLGYALLTLEGVLFHIVNENKIISPLSDENFKLWQFIQQNNQSSSPANYLNTLSKEHPSWKSIVRSRTPTGESCLMLAIQYKNINALQSLLELQEDNKKLFSNTYLLNDSSENGTTLLIAAVQTEDEKIISSIHNIISCLKPSIIRKYLSLTDNWKRSVGHYFFHAPWLIEQLGHLICWEQRDQNGQTPLFALCRSYDHNDYDSLINRGFKAWSKSITLQRPQEKPSILDHIDNKGNTLLHIVKDKKAVEQVLYYNVDVNWPNEKGLTPLMVYSKFSRLSAILSLSQHPLIDLERTDFRSLNALDLAKEMQTLTILDEILAFSKEPINGRVTVITRVSFVNGELHYVIKSGIPPNSSSITTVRRTLSDFMFLHKWLSYENPNSWVPQLIIPRNPFSVPTMASRQTIHEIELLLNTFLRVLISHPTFGQHELLWEFILVQDMSQQQCIDRSRRKLESRKEFQYEDFTLYGPGDLEAIEIFFDHARKETGKLATSLARLAKIIGQLRNMQIDLSEAVKIFDNQFSQVEFLQPLYNKVLRKDYILSQTIQDQYMSVFSLDITYTASTSEAVLSALSRPIGLIHQLKEQDSILINSRALLAKLTSKTGWPLGMFEEKREREIQATREKVYTSQSEVEKLSNDIKYAHITLASELGDFHSSQGAELHRIIEAFTNGMIKQEKERLNRLERLTAICKRLH